MALYPNARHLSLTRGRKFGPAPGLDPYLRGLGDRINRFAGEEYAATASTPQGYGLRAYVPAIKAGGISTAITGSGQAQAAAIAALIAQASIDGEGSLEAFGALIVNLIASIQGSGAVTSADVLAFLNLAASISGSGAAGGTATGLGQLIAAVAASGAAGGTATGTGQLSANIVGYGDLTPEGIRDAVWNAVLAGYQLDGTAGKALSTAGSGGVDLVALANAILAAAQATPIHADVRKVRGQTVNGSGIEADPWGP